MMKTAQELASEGNCVLTPTYPVLEDVEITDEIREKLKEAHFKRIEMSDAIFVININNYIGESTKLEIEHAKKLGKEIVYYTEWA